MPRGDKKAYETLTSRMPQALVDQARRYASQHHRTVAELLREGLELRLAAAGESPLVSEVRHALPALLLEALRVVLPEVLPPAGGEPALDLIQGQTEDRPPGAEGQTEERPPRQGQTEDRPLPKKGQTKGRPRRKEPAPGSASGAGPGLRRGQPGGSTRGQTEERPSYDARRYVLGALCPHRHAYGTTDKSLRRRTPDGRLGSCLGCERSRQQQARARRRVQQVGTA